MNAPPVLISRAVGGPLAYPNRAFVYRHRLFGNTLLASGFLDTKSPDALQRLGSLNGAGYGNRTRLLGLGSRCTTDVLTLHLSAGTSITDPSEEFNRILRINFRIRMEWGYGICRTDKGVYFLLLFCMWNPFQ